MATALIIAAVVIVVVAYALIASRGDVSPSDARNLVEQGALLVDVRTREEFAGGHIHGAMNIPVQELDRRIGEIEAKNRPIVLYCRSGNRSGRAARLLRSRGYSAVHNLGAMSRW